MITNGKNIIYRGSLKSCNYSCTYCPFSKIKINMENIEKDKQNLLKFVDKLNSYNFTNKINVFITPYGEAMIYEHYQNVLIDLSNKEYIKNIGCQTNLSLNIDNFINKLRNNKNSKKIILWATYHFNIENIDIFIEKVKKLSEFINITVGVVGSPNNIEQIIYLREKLPINIYLWINKMDGLKRKYNLNEIETFKNIDPMFYWEIKEKQIPNCLCGKEDFFIDFKGNLILCHKNKIKIGNLYKNEKIDYNFNCKGSNCNCYLTYSKLKHFKQNKFFENNNLFRLPNKLNLDAIFLDIDGTICNNQNKISIKIINALEYISKKTKIYLATELPYNIAIKKCNNIKHLISGGIFASGSHYLDFGKNIEKFNYIDENIQINNKNTIIYKNDNKIYKILTSKNININFNNYNIIDYKNGKIGIVAKNINKWYSIKKICNINNYNIKNIMCVGNDENDLCMLEKSGYNVCIPNSKISHFNFDYYLKVEQLPYII